MNSINIGAIQNAEQQLKILGKQMLQQNFDSNLLFFYNLLHLKIHGKSLSFNENYIEEDHLNKIQQHDRLIEQNQLYIENYLIQNKFLNIDTVDMIELFKPLFRNIYYFDEQTLNNVCRHIIKNFGFSELTIAEDIFKLGNIIKHQLIKAGFFKYKLFISDIIFGIVKLFIKYDLFEGLLDLLHYFLNFMKFLDRLIYHYIVSVIQNLIFKLNIPIYHLKEDLIKQYLYKRSINYVEYNVRYVHICLWEKLNIFYFNIIQDQQKTQQIQIPIDFQLLQKLIKSLTTQKTQYQFLFQTIQQFAEFISQIQSQKQKYLSIMIITVCKYLYQEISRSYIIESEYIKIKFDPILLQYYIYCKQYNRINELFSQQKQKENLRPFEKQLVRQLADTFLIKQNNFNRFNSNKSFLHLEKLTRFALNQKFRQLFDFKQHLYAASIFKSMQKRFNFRDMYLKEQYLRK